jgi:hypothetical protein
MIKDFPDGMRTGESWGIQFNTQIFTSDLNGAIQTISMPGAKWSVTLTFNNRAGKEARLLQGFFAGLQGRAGRFWLTPLSSQPLGTVSNSGALTAAAVQGATSITADGFDASQSELFYAGDWFEINGELKKTTSTISSDVSGEATIEFTPPIRISVPIGTVVKVDEPRCQMMLSDDSVNWQITSPTIYSLVVNCEEALDI